MTAIPAEALELAARLSAQAGLPAPKAVRRLQGGKNNRVFQVDDAAVLKLYHWDARDSRDRLRAEWRFLSYAWARGVRSVPEPLARDDAAHAGLYAKVPGRPFAAGEITAAHVRAALEFVLAVNTAPRDPAALDPGSEACFSLAEHVATVDRRVERLAEIDAGAPHAAEAEALVRSRLMPAWQQVRESLLHGAQRLGIAPDARVPDAALCVSPSDFGFHNALVDGERIWFVDFEYAGRDDPAKLVCDFFCQPSVPVSTGWLKGFASGLADGLGLDPVHAERCRLLLDAYRIKWTCIIMNDFLPLGSARRAYADIARTEDRASAQLARAAAKLDEIGPTERMQAHGLS
jgi:hypothetical protein